MTQKIKILATSATVYFLFTNIALAVDPVTINTVELQNPLNSINSIEGLLVAILNIVVVLMIPIIVFFIILAGFKYVTARGNSSQIQDATRALMYAIIGGVLVLGASAISEIIKSTVEAF